MRASERAGDAREPLGPLVVLGSGDPYDPRIFSGTTRSMTLALERRFSDVVVVRNSQIRGFSFARKALRKISGGRLELNTVRALAAWHARRLDRIIARLHPRAIVSIANSAVTAELGARFPVIHVSDTTFALMADFYDSFRKLGDASLRSGEACEQRAIDRAAAVTVSSRWAAQSVCGHYGKSPDLVHVISWGCNIPHVDDATVPPEPVQGGECRLLFIGLDWKRKGGDILLETARRLAARGMDFRIDIVGAQPPVAVDMPQVHVHGLLRKSEPSEMARLLDLFANASLLFLPTRQDCTPMVFAEANAFGIPALSSDVGGVNGVITHGENGLLLPAGAGAEDFAGAIVDLWTDRPRYLALRKSSRAAYVRRLNWDVWSARLGAVIESLSLEGSARP